MAIAIGPDGAVVGAVACAVEDVDVEVGGVEGVFALAAPGGEREGIGGPFVLVRIIDKDAAGVLVVVATAVAEEEQLVIGCVVLHDADVGVVRIGAGDVFGFGVAPGVGGQVEDPQRVLVGGDNGLAAAADVDEVAFGVDGGGGIDAEGWEFAVW